VGSGLVVEAGDGLGAEVGVRAEEEEEEEEEA
jgi:hypothetical protein